MVYANVSNLTSLYDIWQYDVQATQWTAFGYTGSFFGIIILTLVWFILFFAMKSGGFSTARCASGCSLVCAILGSLLWSVDILGTGFMVGFFALFVVTLIMLKLDKPY